jgi:hypothetical protein
MLLYHTTTPEVANAILAEGFRDGEGSYLTDQIYRGVWFASRPLNEADGAPSDTVVLVIDIPEDVVAPYDRSEKRKRYREFLIPADLVNQYGPPEQLEEEEEYQEPPEE